MPNADFMLPPPSHANHLSPVKGEFGRRRGRIAHLVHARLSSSTSKIVSKVVLQALLRKVGGAYLVKLGRMKKKRKFGGAREVDKDAAVGLA